MRQVLGPGALGRPRGMGWGGRWEGGSGWETHVNPWLIHVNVWQKPLQYCKVISLQLIKINEKNKKIKRNVPYDIYAQPSRKSNEDEDYHTSSIWRLPMYLSPLSKTYEQCG